MEIIDAQPESGFIVIDEVQRVPELPSVVHRLIEIRKGWTFVLTGSSARKLIRSGIDLLGGLFFIPCMDFLQELHPDRLLDEAFT